MFRFLKLQLLLLVAIILSSNLFAQFEFSTDYFRIHINGNGFITSMLNTTVHPKREFSPGDKPSPLLCLYNSAKDLYYFPQRANYNATTHKMVLQYKNGSIATVSVASKNGKYIRFELLSLTNREEVDNVQWGAIHTNITNVFGEMLGVARDTDASVNYSIGLLALDDVTTGGPSNTVGDAAPFEYLIHSPDAKRLPLPGHLKEGEHFTIGGDGINDVAFYSYPEEYYRILYGNAAGVDTLGRISVVQHASDRAKPKNIFFSLMPRMEANKPVHQERQAIPGVDYIGSKVALWGSPDTIALMTVIQNIVRSEGLPYPLRDGKWIKDPARYVPDVFWADGNYDSAVSYANQLGFKDIEAWNLGEYYPNRSDDGDIPLKIPMAAGKISIREFTDQSNAKGVSLGLHTLQNFLQRNISSDVSPVPNDSLCYLQKRTLVNDLSLSDTNIVVNDPLYLDEVAGWEAHPVDANIIKIGKELIHYNGVTHTYPYTLRNVKRGYWGTSALSHKAGVTMRKLQTNCYGGLTPDIFLQDKYADYYARVLGKNGMRYIDFDGEEGLFYQGHGEYSVKRFYRRLFTSASKEGIDLIRITGATLSGGAWHYHSIWNVGGGNHMYNIKTRSWGIEGKDLRNVTFGNYFPSTFGGNFELEPGSTVQQFENIQAISVGMGVTYIMKLSEKTVEGCPNKFPIFRAIKTWENARAANAFPTWVKKELANASQYFHLEEVDGNNWNLFKVKEDGSGKRLFVGLVRDKAYPVAHGHSKAATLLRSKLRISE